jgi:hypothetical protein
LSIPPIKRFDHVEREVRWPLLVPSGSPVDTTASEQQQKRGAVVHHEPETLGQLKPTITRLAQRLVLADRLCGPPRADRAGYTTHLNPRGHKPRVPMIFLAREWPAAVVIRVGPRSSPTLGSANGDRSEARLAMIARWGNDP